MLLLTAVFVAKAEDGQKIPSKVQKVIVFLKGAQVTRTVMANIPEGTTDLVFNELSPGIDAQSIQVNATGEFTVLSVRHEIKYLNPVVKTREIDDLRTAQKALRDKIELQNTMLSIYQQEEAILAKNQFVKAENASLDVIKLKEALDFQTERLTLLKQKEQGVKNQVDALQAEVEKYDQQIAEMGQGHSTATSNIIVTVSSKAATQSVFTLSYLVRDASWYPTYDIRAKNVSSPVSITYKANVAQRTGEDWKNVKLTLSTGNPAVSGNKPELSPYYLSTNMLYSNNSAAVDKVSGRVFDTNDRQPLVGVSIRVKGTTIGTSTDANGNYSLQLPNGAQTLVISYIGFVTQEKPVTGSFMSVGLSPSSNSLNEVVVVGYSTTSDKDDGYIAKETRGAVPVVNSIPLVVDQQENQTNFEFNIDNPYSIPSDGKQILVEISKVDVKAGFQYAVAPKLSTDVFLTAQVTDWNKYNFLSGEANLFFEGTFIGKSLIDTHSVADTLNLSLGTDKNIVVTRTLQKDLSEKKTFGANRRETKSWLIDIKNRKNQKVNLLVEDQVPVSQNSAIEVETQESSGIKPDALTGKISWNLLLNSQDDKKVQLRYQVKYPKNQSVIVQ